MRSRNSRAIDKGESAHLAAVKSLACVVCHYPGPSEAHHIRQGDHYTTVALCKECHTGRSGIHGDKTMFRIRKWDELDALNETLRGVANAR